MDIPGKRLLVDKTIPRGTGLAAVLVAGAPSVRLDWSVRQRSRFDAVDSTGRGLGVFLPRGCTVRGGDVLVAEDGSLIRVDAAPEPLMIVRADPARGRAFDLMRAAYHLGNRHVQLELRPDHLRLERDHVLAEMLVRMGLVVEQADEAFEPESGAYSGGGGHAHHAHHAHDGDHDHDHDHHHHHDHDHRAHAPADSHGAGRVHGHGGPVRPGGPRG